MKHYRKLELSEVLRMLADNQEQVFAVKYNEIVHEVTLLGIDLYSKSELVYSAKGRGWHRKVYEIIEIPDPLIPLKKLEALRELYPEYEWIAMDECEEAYLFQHESPSNNEGVWTNEYVHLSVPTLDGYATDWKTSLIHIPTEIERLRKLEAEV